MGIYLFFFFLFAGNGRLSRAAVAVLERRSRGKSSVTVATLCGVVGCQNYTVANRLPLLSPCKKCPSSGIRVDGLAVLLE